MKRKIIWVVVSCLIVFALLATSCAKAEEEVAPVVKEEAPVVKEVAPVVKEAAPAEAENMKRVTLTKNDGTVVEVLVEKPQYGGVFIMPLSSAILAWDEALQPPWTTMYQLSYINEELIQGNWTRGPIGTNEFDWMTTGYWANPQLMVGALAESWEFPDDETIIYQIRKGVHWQNKPPVNGREFTADDAAFNLRRIYINITTSAMYGTAGVARPTDVYATDKYTLVVKNPPGQQGMTWEYLSNQTRHFPREVIEKYGDHNKWEYVTGTGPFIVTDYVPMSQVTFKRNPDYWMKDPLFPENQLPYLDGIKQLVIPDASTRLSALRTGKIDWLHSVSEEDSESLWQTTPQLQYVGSLSRGYSGFGYRIDKPELPFDDIRVRRALWLGVNNQEWLDTYYGGRGTIIALAVMPLPGLMNAHTPVEELPLSDDGFDLRKLYGYYPEEARQLLTDAGYPNGFTTKVVINSASPEQMDYAQIVAAYWAEIGVDLQIDAKEYGTYQSIFGRKTHEEMIVSGHSGDMPYRMTPYRAGAGFNWGMVADPKIDNYYYPLATAAYYNVPERERVMKETNIYIISQSWYFSPPVGYVNHFWWPWVRNYHGELGQGIYDSTVPKYIWLDQALKKAMGK